MPEDDKDRKDDDNDKGLIHSEADNSVSEADNASIMADDSVSEANNASIVADKPTETVGRIFRNGDTHAPWEKRIEDINESCPKLALVWGVPKCEIHGRFGYDNIVSHMCPQLAKKNQCLNSDHSPEYHGEQKSEKVISFTTIIHHKETKIKEPEEELKEDLE